MSRSPALLVLLLAACGADPVELCEDFAAAFATTAEGCGYDYDEYYLTLLDMTVEGTCADVTGIRDAKEMRDACIPWVEALPCEQLDDPDMSIKPFCEDQLRL